jgi:hypothetical protein
MERTAPTAYSPGDGGKHPGGGAVKLTPAAPTDGSADASSPPDSYQRSQSPSQSNILNGQPVIQILKPVTPNPRRSVSQRSGMGDLSPHRMQKHLDIRAKLAVETKHEKLLEDEVKRYFRSPVKKMYSRGHEIHEAGSEIATRPIGTSPIVSRVSSVTLVLQSTDLAL